MKATSLACLATSALLVGLIPCQADGRGMVSVNPTVVLLSANETSALVSLTNEGQEQARFELSAFAWQQAPDGQMLLGPTEDVVFFPQLFSLEPGESRNVRVAAVAPPAAFERTYRLFIEQLPPSQAERKPGTVQVLTRIGIPIFLEPSTLVRRGELQELVLSGDVLNFTIANTGTVHIIPESVKVRGLTANGAVAFEHPVSAWYILAGGTRAFQLALKDLPAGGADSFVVQLQAKGIRLEAGVTRAMALRQPARTIR